MIPFERAPEPSDFERRVRAPGKLWLSKGGDGMPAYWRRAAKALRTSFRELCGYSAMWLSTPGTADHFVSRDEDRTQAYEWNNLRYAAGWINSAKSNLRSAEMLDPFEVGDDWFEVLLPSCQLVVTDRCPPDDRARAETMLKRLGLGHDERVVEYRQEWFRMYTDGELSLDGLAKKAPLIARAVRKRMALNEE